MYQRSNSRVPPIPQPGPTHHDFLLQQQLAAAQYQHMAQQQQQASQLMGIPGYPGHPGAAPGMSGRNMMELDAMYMQHMHQQALAQHLAASQQSQHFPIGGHPQFPSFGQHQMPRGLAIDPAQSRQKSDRRSGGHSHNGARTPGPPVTPQPPNPFSHKPTTPTPTVTIPSMFPPAASDPLYSMISAEQKLRERERHLYERSRQESPFNHAAVPNRAPSQPPSFSNSIFNIPDLQHSPRISHQPQPSPKPALNNDIANHYPLDLSSAPSRINCENYEPVRVVAPSVQREIDRLKAEKERRKLLKAQKTNQSSATNSAKIRPRKASISSESSKKAPKKPKNLPKNSPILPNPPQIQAKAQLPPQIQSILSQPEPEPVKDSVPPSVSPKIHFPEIGKAENQDGDKETGSNKADDESNSNISSSTPLLQQQLQHNQLLFQQQQQLQLQQAQQQQQQISSHSLSTQQLINQSKDIIRTHEDYIRCKQERQKVMPPSSNQDFLSKIYENVLADKMQAVKHAQTQLTTSNGIPHSSSGSLPKSAHHEHKLPLLTEAIRTTNENYAPPPKNKAETLENLKQQIFRNWNKSGTLPQPREIFPDSKRPGSPIDDELRRKRSKSNEIKVEPVSSERAMFNLTDRIKEEPGSSSSLYPHAQEKLPKEEEDDTFDSSLGALEIVEEPDMPTFEEQTAESMLNPDTFDANDSDDSLTVRKPKTPGRKQRDETPQMKIYKLIKRTPCPPNVKKLSCKHASGETLLHVAGRRGYLENIAYYLQMGCDINAKDNAGFTPLHEAVTKGHLNCVKLLLEQGADPNEQSKDGTRPIHDASENGDMSILRMLLSFGADPTLTCYSGESAYDLAEDMSDTKAFLKEYREYLKSGNKNDELPPLYEPRDIDIIEEFVKESLNPTKRPSDDLPVIENLKIYPEKEDPVSEQHFKIEISDNPLPESYWLTINEKSNNFILVRDVKNRLIPDKIKPVVLSLEDLIRQVGASSLVQLPDDLPEEVELLPLNNETTNLIGSKFWSRACA